MKDNQIEEKDRSSVKTATIIGIITIVLNLVLGVSKMILGKLWNYDSVFSDGVHGTGDILTTIISTISVWIAARKKDNKYNYGHERWSSIFCIILAVILVITALTITSESTESLIIKDYQNNENKPGDTFWWVSMSISIASVVIKEFMFYITYYGAKKTNSKAMKADAWHQRIDALSSIAAIIALLGYYWLPNNNLLDPILSYPIAIMVIVIGIETFTQAAKELTDHAISNEELGKVKEVLYKVIPQDKVKLIRTRIYQEKFYVDVFVLLDPNTTLSETDNLVDKIKETLFDNFPSLKDVYVICEPDNEAHRNKEETLR